MSLLLKQEEVKHMIVAEREQRARAMGRIWSADISQSIGTNPRLESRQ